MTKIARQRWALGMLTAVSILSIGGPVNAAPIYLNDQNISVVLGPSMSPEPFGNRTTAASLASVIDAPSATSSELHNQTTHVWVNGGALELVFNFGTEYDLQTLHFWNYHSEAFDVDDIDFTFFDASGSLVGQLPNVSPALGNSSGNDNTPIFAEDFALSFPSNVQFVNAMLTGSNGQVDFNNIGFTAELSPSSVPEPATLGVLGLGILGVGVAGWLRR